MPVTSLLAHLLAAHLFLFCVVYCAYSLCVRWLRSESVTVRWCGTYVVSCWILAVLFHVLLVLHSFRLIPALAAAVLLALVTFAFRRGKESLLSSIRSDVSRVLRGLESFTDSASITVMVCLVFMASLLLARGLVLPHLANDSLTYHDLKAGLWVQQGRMFGFDAPGGWEYYRSFFGGGELFTAWAMLFPHSTLLSGVQDWIAWAFLGLMSAAIAMRFDIPKRYAVLIAACFLVSVELAEGVGSGYVDTLMYTMLLGGLLFSLRYLDSRHSIDLILGGAALGLSASVKVNGLLLAVATAIALLVLLMLAREPLRWGHCLAGLSVFLLPVVPWFLINYQAVGCPLGCVPLAIGPFALGRVPRNLQWFLDRPDLDVLGFSTELADLGKALAGFGIALLLPILALPGLLAGLRIRPRERVLPLVIVAATIMLYYTPSFRVIRLAWPNFSGRFLVPCVLLPPIVGMGLVCRDRKGKILLEGVMLVSMITAAMFYWYAYVRPGPPAERSSVIPGVALICLACLFGWRIRGFLFERKHLRTIAASVFVFWIVLLVVGDFAASRIRIAAYSGSKIMTGLQRYWVPALEALEDQPSPKVIAVTYGPLQISHQAFIAPFLGRDLQNEIVYVSPEKSGRLVPHHPESQALSKPELDAWLSRLRKRRVTHVMSFRPAPVELTWMDDHPQCFTRLAGEKGDWGLFQFRWDSACGAD